MTGAAPGYHEAGGERAGTPPLRARPLPRPLASLRIGMRASRLVSQCNPAPWLYGGGLSLFCCMSGKRYKAAGLIDGAMTVVWVVGVRRTTDDKGSSGAKRMRLGIARSDPVWLP